MNRTIIRMATVAALLNGGAAPFPTSAGNDVYDSRQDAISHLPLDQAKAVINVRTDEDRFKMREKHDRHVTIRIELSMLIASRVNGQVVAGWPTTDAGLEMFLDLLEYQTLSALYGFSPWAQWFRAQGFVLLEEDITSVPLWTRPEEGRARLAARELTIPCALALDCIPPPLKYGEPPNYPSDDLVPIDTAGDPVVPTIQMPARLRAVFDYIAAHGQGSVKKNAEQMRDRLIGNVMPQATAYPLLRRVGVTIPGAEDGSLGAPDQATALISTGN